jgi:dipeptidyl aminopeptidase/acylaminoacyl peptidase
MVGFKIYSLEKRSSKRVNLPAGTFVSDMTWSPDGNEIAFLAHLKKGSQVWTADVESAEAKPVSDAFVMATLTGARGRSSGGASRMLQWTPDGSLLTLLVPANRGPEPSKNPIPGGPIIRTTREKPTPTRTYPWLLKTEHDMDLFRYYTTSQLALLAPNKAPQLLGAPAMYSSISLSPDSKNVLAEKLAEPLSFIVSYSSFGRDLQVLDMTGRVVSTIRNTPLQEAASRDRSGGPGQDLPRDVAWRADGKGLGFLLREPGEQEGESGSEAEESGQGDNQRKDQLMLLAPPFDMSQAQTLVASEKRFSQVAYSLNGRYAIATMSGGPGEDRGQQIVAYDLTAEEPEVLVLAKDIDPEDPVNLPGEIVTRRTGNGLSYALMSSDGASVFLQGPGHKENFLAQPFIDRVTIANGEKERIFEGSTSMFVQADRFQLHPPGWIGGSCPHLTSCRLSGRHAGARHFLDLSQ